MHSNANSTFNQSETQVLFIFTWNSWWLSLIFSQIYLWESDRILIKFFPGPGVFGVTLLPVTYTVDTRDRNVDTICHPADFTRKMLIPLQNDHSGAFSQWMARCKFSGNDPNSTGWYMKHLLVKWYYGAEFLDPSLGTFPGQKITVRSTKITERKWRFQSENAKVILFLSHHEVLTCAENGA